MLTGNIPESPIDVFFCPATGGIIYHRQSPCFEFLLVYTPYLQFLNPSRTVCSI
jgi:hypothetical protein